ncbi:hypothetical protein NliqN6_2340 [Naganishia liquefaciens]|uniref:PH domain-containing protein n=1 Tax=Naganishia liquefaciens TaxID=104408 RepID=A0A8H3TS75_9TREE|nr:hypothetical protein NliqN6_2340 [Naganishia liquefaciens]
MSFLFSKQRRRSSVDPQESPAAATRRKPSVDLLAEDITQEETAGSGTHAGSKIGVLKSKLTSRSILNLNAKHDDPTSPTSPAKRRFSLSGQGSPTSAASPNSPTASKAGRRSSLANSAIPQTPPTSSARLASVTGGNTSFPPGTTVFDEPNGLLDENAVRRRAAVQTESTPVTRAALNDVWKPIDPERRPMSNAASNAVPARPAVPSNLGSGSMESANTLPITPASPISPAPASNTKSPSTRPEIGKISIPPPHLPSRLASSSYFRDTPGSSPGGWGARTPGPQSARTPGGTGWGMTIIPSTPMPRPIANLPTLRDQNTGGSAPGSRASSRPTSSSGVVAGYGFPFMANGAEGSRVGENDGNNQSGSRTTSPNRGVEASPAEIRRAKAHMPVMLREPSHRPPAQAQETQEESDDEDGDDDSSSEEGSGPDSSDSDTETEAPAITQRNRTSSEITRDRTGSASSGTSTSSSVSSDDVPMQSGVTSTLGNAGTRGLLSHRVRQPSGSHPGHAHQASVSSITEENEEDPSADVNFGNYDMTTSPMQLTSTSSASGTAAQQSAIATRRHSDQPHLNLSSTESPDTPAAAWGLATPGTPTAGASSFFTASPGQNSSQWTSFGAQTPTNGPNRSFSQSRADATATSQELSNASDEPRPVPDVEYGTSREQSGNSYFDGPIPDPSSNSLAELDTLPTPTQNDIPSRRVSEDGPGALAPPLEALNLGLPVDVAAQPSGPLEILPEEPGANTVPEPQLDAAVIEHATRTDEPVIVNTIPEPNPASDFAALKASRPSFYKQASRSMINLSTSGRESTAESQSAMPSSAAMDRTATNTSVSSNVSGPIPSGFRTPASTRSSADWTRPPPTPGVGMMQPFKFSAVTDTLQSPKQMVQNRQLQALGPSPLKRRRSMDDMKEKLPDYAPPAKGVYLPRPREEEGREKLPEYFCHVHIEGYLPRKMEFTAPGVQARDRSWKRHYFVIHGTALSVYKHDIHKVPLKAGDPHGIPEIDEADYDNLHVHRPGELRRGSLASTAAAATAERRGSPVPGGNSPNGSRRGSVDANATANTREGLVAAAAARRASISAGTTISTSASHGPDAKDLALFTSSSNASTNSGGRRASVTSSSQPSQMSASSSHARDIAAHLPFHGSNALIKQYTLQNAESGLAADYVKKRNVVRVRVEGEQFLLQTDSAKDVVDWIEAFQAATNVALDLDSRPMPKIITLPRRRRRRRPGDPVPNPQQTGVPDTEDTPEGNARAVAEAERLAAAERDRNIDNMERMLAEDQAA